MHTKPNSSVGGKGWRPWSTGQNVVHNIESVTAFGFASRVADAVVGRRGHEVMSPRKRGANVAKAHQPGRLPLGMTLQHMLLR